MLSYAQMNGFGGKVNFTSSTPALKSESSGLGGHLKRCPQMAGFQVSTEAVVH